MKKVLFLSSWYPSRVHSTLGNFVSYHVKAVSKTNKVHVLYITADDTIKDYEIVTESIDGIQTTIVYFKRGFFKYLNYFIAFLKGLKYVTTNFNFDLVHMNIMHPAIWQALYIKWIKKTPYLVSENWHGFQDLKNEQIGFLQSILIKKGFKNAYAICPVSKQMLKGMKDQGLKANYHVVPNVVNTKLFKPVNRTYRTKFKFLHVSTLDDNIKNVSGIIQAFSKLKDEKATLKIIGEGEKSYIFDLINKYKLNDKIEVEGEKTYNEIAIEMQNANAFILFSNIENLPLVLIEAMATGMPIITTNVGGIPEIFNSFAGYMIKPKEEEELYLSMKRMIADYDQFDYKIISNYAIQHFSNEKVAEAFNVLYNEMTKN